MCAGRFKLGITGLQFVVFLESFSGQLRENFITCKIKCTFLAIPCNQMTSKSSAKSLSTCYQSQVSKQQYVDGLYNLQSGVLIFLRQDRRLHCNKTSNTVSNKTTISNNPTSSRNHMQRNTQNQPSRIPLAYNPALVYFMYFIPFYRGIFKMADDRRGSQIKINIGLP